MKENTHLDCFREAGPYIPIKQKGRGPVPKQQVGSLLEGLKSVPGMASMGSPPLKPQVLLPVWSLTCLLSQSPCLERWESRLCALGKP